MMFAKDLEGNHPRADADWAKLQEPTENVLDGRGFGHATGSVLLALSAVS